MRTTLCSRRSHRSRRYDTAVAEYVDEDELPLAYSLRPPLLENKQGEQKRAEPIEPASDTAMAETSSNSDEITSEKVLDALLRLGYDDYAVLSAYHIQVLQAAAAAAVQRPSKSCSTRTSSIIEGRSCPPTCRRPSFWPTPHRIDMSRFLPSIPRHPVSDPRIELSVSSSTLASLPSSSSSSAQPSRQSSPPQAQKVNRRLHLLQPFPLQSTTPTPYQQPTTSRSKKNKPSTKDKSSPLHQQQQQPVEASIVVPSVPKRVKFDPNDPTMSEASRVKSALMKAAWMKKHALMQAGMTAQEASERLRKETEEARNVPRRQEHVQRKRKKKKKQQQEAADGEGKEEKEGKKTEGGEER